jgi:serine/threonine protein kinase
MTDQFTGQILADKYRIGRILRDSDLGKIYHGSHLVMDKPVTVKILSPALAVDGSIVKQFSAEARTASQITHPNILNVTDFGSDTDGNVFIVYEGVEGENLKDIIKSEGMLAPARAIDLTKQIASALTAAHAHKVVHGALSADNVVITEGPGGETAKVLNFGAAKPNEEIAADHDPASASEVEYLSPEQCSDTGETDARSDIYSLGVVFYEMLAGEVPFSGEKSTDVMLKHVQDLAPPLAAYRKDLRPELEPVVLKALAKDPEMRYQTAEEFIEALDTVPETAVASEQVKAAAASNNIWKTAFIVLIGIMVLASALIYATSSRQTNPVTQLQPDVNGLPVQPINPATGTDEQNLASMMLSMGSMQPTANSNTSLAPGVMPGGDGFDPWANGGARPVGAPPPGYVPPPGQTVTIDGSGGQFMPPLTDIPPGCTLLPSGTVLCPKPIDENAAKPTPTPKPAASPDKQKTPPSDMTNPVTKEGTPATPPDKKIDPVKKDTKKPNTTDKPPTNRKPRNT